MVYHVNFIVKENGKKVDYHSFTNFKTKNQAKNSLSKTRKRYGKNFLSSRITKRIKKVR